MADATKKSGFLKALEHFWNTQWSYRKKLILIVCGSAASWMLKNIVFSKGGLHNRITVNIPLAPFTISETYAYLKHRGHQFSEQHILQFYMVMGGIPHYLRNIKSNMSVAQNINALCFQKGGVLFDEFDKLFHSLYEDPETYIKIVRAIAKKKNGISRDELISAVNKLSDGGTLNVKMKSLEEAEFISTFLPLGHSRRGVHYKLIDEYTIFYLNWIEPFRKKTRITSTSTHRHKKMALFLLYREKSHFSGGCYPLKLLTRLTVAKHISRSLINILLLTRLQFNAEQVLGHSFT